MHARVRISACLALCVSASTHKQTHTGMYPVRLYVVSVSVSLLPQHLPPPPQHTPLQHLHPHTVGAYRHPVRAVNRLLVCSRCRL